MTLFTDLQIATSNGIPRTSGLNAFAKDTPAAVYVYAAHWTTQHQQLQKCFFVCMACPNTTDSAEVELQLKRATHMKQRNLIAKKQISKDYTKHPQLNADA